MPLIDEWRCVTLGGYRGQSGEQLFVTLQQAARLHQKVVKGSYSNSVAEGVKSAVEISNENDTLLVFGSFHTVGEFLTYSQV